jgi:hypothetical protein
LGNDKNRIVIDRSYIDNFSVKKFTEENLIDKYFSNIDVSLRSVGMVGFTTEQISNISEDLFNTATVLFRETFPNRAQIPESLYSHAAIFQLSNAFSSAASCNFLVVLEEEAIIKNMINNYDKETGIYSFFIDKNTIISVENIPFVIDYDVEIRIVKKILNDKTEDYIFSASYVIPENFKSTMSASNANNDPYIKIRRSADGYIALELRCHQCMRNIITEDIVNTNSINYPIIDVPFDGKLAGFDIRYKTSSEDDSGYKQLQSLVVYSQPIEEPFCYYQLKDENTLRITFNTKDEYFTPEYGSTLEITTYTTLGAEGNFDVYTGNEIAVITNDERYTYTTPYLTAAKPLTASTGGRDQLSLDELQSLTVMSYRTATALTTDADLQEYFYNYKSLYSNSEIMFIKKRDDIYERIYSAFIIMKNAEYIYKTNTLSLDLNLSDMENPEKTIYMIHPGTLFTVDSEKFGYADFFRDDELKVQNEQWYQEYLIEKKNHNIPYIDDDYDPSDLPDYLRDRQASFAEYKKRKGYKDKVTIFDYDVEKNTAQRRPNPITMTIEDFYNYYNHLMNARSILLKEKMNEDIGELSKSKIEHYGEDESGICPICSENKVNISLPCSHFFCEKCLSTWVVKSESCPLCRFKLTLNKKDPSGVAGAQSWNIIDEVDEVQIEKEQEDTLKLLTKKFFSQNK